MSAVEEAKDALLGYDVIREYILEKKFTNTGGKYISDKFFPKIFWELSHYVDIKNSEDGRLLKFRIHTDSLEEAIALAILSKSSGRFYEECEPQINGAAYKPYRIIVRESYYTKEKWGEEQIRKTCLVSYQVKGKNGSWIVDYETHSSSAKYALTTIPKFFYEMSEGVLVPYNWCSLTKDIEDQSIEDYPYFEYKGYIFKTTQWIPTQKCVCGHCDEYVDDYEGGSDIKVEVWEVDLLEKDTVYLKNRKLICNKEYVSISDEQLQLLNSSYHDVIRKELKKAFPKAKQFNSWFSSFSL